jgi:hypothetical protein
VPPVRSATGFVIAGSSIGWGMENLSARQRFTDDCGESGGAPSPGLGEEEEGYTRRSTIIFLISAIAFAGLRPFGQVFEQFMMVWQR